jgi:hypothetical protein
MDQERNLVNRSHDVTSAWAHYDIQLSELAKKAQEHMDYYGKDAKLCISTSGDCVDVSIITQELETDYELASRLKQEADEAEDKLMYHRITVKLDPEESAYLDKHTYRFNYWRMGYDKKD